MSEPMFKYVNALDPRSGRALRDRKTGRPVSRLVRMTDDEIAAFEAERAVSNPPQNEEGQDQ